MNPSLRPTGLAGFMLLMLSPGLTAETVLQYFNTSWAEITRRLPEIAEAGYTSLWLPQPAKGSSGTYSVGYDPVDRFDLGDKNRSGTVATRYGTKAELLGLVETAHRFGVRIYFDNVMAHSAGPLDDVPPGTLLPGVPGFVPEDFHLVRRSGGDSGAKRIAGSRLFYIENSLKGTKGRVEALQVARKGWSSRV